MMIAGLVRDDVPSGDPGRARPLQISSAGHAVPHAATVRNESGLVIIITPYLSKPVAHRALKRTTISPPPVTARACSSVASTARLRNHEDGQTERPVSRHGRVHLQMIRNRPSDAQDA